MLSEQEIIKLARKVFNDEIEGLIQVGSSLNSGFAKCVQLILKCKGKTIVTGIGKSGHIARKMASTFASTGTPSFFVHPAEALHGDLGMIEEEDVVIALSYSGESDELNSILPIIKRKTHNIIAFTSNPSSTLAQSAQHVLDIKVDKEACPLNLAPTTSTTASLALGDALAVCLLSIRGFKAEDFALSHPGGALGRRLLTKVNDLMHAGELLPVVTTECSLQEIVVEISQKRLGLTGVIDSHTRKLVGIITDGDLRRALEQNLDLKTATASHIMTKNPKVLNQNTLAIEAVELMEQNKITGFLVVDEDNFLIGAFNLHDLFKAKLL